MISSEFVREYAKTLFPQHKIVPVLERVAALSAKMDIEGTFETGNVIYIGSFIGAFPPGGVTFFAPDLTEISGGVYPRISNMDNSYKPNYVEIAIVEPLAYAEIPAVMVYCYPDGDGYFAGFRIEKVV